MVPQGDRGDHNIYNPGQAHLALTVEDLDEEYGRLLEGGVEFFSEPQAITAGVNAGGSMVYLYGFDKLVHELVQPPPHRLKEYRARLAAS